MNEVNYKVKVTVGDAIVEIEGPEKGVATIVRSLSEILRRQPEVPGEPPPASSYDPSKSSKPEFLDIRTFFNEKEPKSDKEATATAAFYLRYVAPKKDRRETIDSTCLEEAFRLANYPLPKRIDQTLRDTKRAGYIDPGSEAGVFSLNPVGYNLVKHSLGAQEAIPRSRKKRSAKKAKTSTKVKSKRKKLVKKT